MTKAVDEARDTEGSTGQDKKQMSGGVFIATGGASSVVHKENGAAKTMPGNEEIIAQA